MVMKINRLEIYKSPIRLKAPFVTSLGRHDFAENILIRIQTDSGLTGFGECSPFRTINGESMDTAFVVGQYLAKALLGTNPLELEQGLRILDAVIYGNSSIKSAFDMALHDIASQEAGLPLYKFLSGKETRELVTDYTVSMGEPGKMAKDAKEIVALGFRIIKVKLGRNKEQDVERIRKIREAIGIAIPMRIDANQGWDVDDALYVLKALQHFGIQYCEEPIARWNYMELPKVKKYSPIPVMADESCCDHHDAKRLIALGACDLFNLKLGKSSGLVNARKIIHLAEQAGIDMQVGGFLESRLGFTASAHLALSSPRILYCDFDTPLMFKEDPVVGGIQYGKGGVVTVPNGIGLGAVVEEGYLKRLEKSVVSG